MWFPTDKDIDNIIKNVNAGLEVGKLEEVVRQLKQDGDKVEFHYNAKEVTSPMHTAQQLTSF